jgi:hypothetical protein
MTDKSIATMLVETTARLMAGDAAGAESPETVMDWEPRLYAQQARAIVAEFYGKPCDGSTSAWYARAPWRESKVHEVLGAQRPSDECATCGWPRGEHGRAGK